MRLLKGSMEKRSTALGIELEECGSVGSIREVWEGVDRCLMVVAQWQSTGGQSQLSWVQFSVPLAFFPTLPFMNHLNQDLLLAVLLAIAR